MQRTPQCSRRALLLVPALPQCRPAACFWLPLARTQALWLLLGSRLTCRLGRSLDRAAMSRPLACRGLGGWGWGRGRRRPRSEDWAFDLPACLAALRIGLLTRPALQSLHFTNPEAYIPVDTRRLHCGPVKPPVKL